MSAEALPLEDGPGWYLYGVVSTGEAPALEQLLGVDPRYAVGVVTEGGLAGVTSRVSLQEFDENALSERLGDAAWLEEKIRAHEQVLEGVLALASVVPCRFCTVYRSEEELLRFLAERGELLAQALERVDGRVELGVKAFVDADRYAESEPSLRELRESVAAAQGGRAYLEARQLERLVDEELASFGGEIAANLHGRLLEAADDGVQLSLQRPEVSGREEEMLFNGAYLVEDRARFERELASLAGEHAESGVELELTGPWPPYNFVPADLGES